MPTPLIRRFFRERRRIALVTLLIFAALHLAGVDAGPLPLPPALALPVTLPLALVALFAGLAMGLVAVLAPGFRGYAEAMALACLLEPI